PIEVPFYDRLADDAFDPRQMLEAAVTERTVAVYVNSPNNPLGTILPERVVDAIVAVARERDLWVLADEAYESLYFGDEPATPIWMRPKLADRVIVTHTLSKSHGLAGARIGYTHGPPQAMATIRSAQTFYSYCASRPMQIAGARAIREGGPWVERARKLYAEAAQKSADAVGVPTPQGGTFLFFDAKPYLRDGEMVLGFLERCVDAGVLLMPGANSGRAYTDWVRLCFSVVPPQQLDEALARLRVALDR
ncbi:pyridoxal phosphate-dependent aminotransferase, partial [Myxococcota bacterium]